MACFYKRGKTQSFSIYIGKDKYGKNKKNGIGGFRTKKEAEYAASQILSELEEKSFINEQDLKFNEFSKYWLEKYSLQVKPSTVRVRQHEINKLKEFLDSVKLKDVTKKQYQDILYLLLKNRLAENTISGVHGTARMIFKKAVELQIIKNDPTEYARPPRKIQTLEDVESMDELPKYLEKDELAILLNFAHDAGLDCSEYTIFLTLAYTGLRAGELCGLKWSDIDFENKTLQVNRTYYNPTNTLTGYILQTPKTKKSRRTIEISDKLITELKVHKARQNKIKLKHANIWFDEDFGFVRERHPGYPIYVKFIGIRMARLLKIAGLPEHLTPHSLRHTHTSLLAEAKVSLEEIMERLGHGDDDTTKQVYLHVTKTMKKEAAQKFEKLMNNL